MFHPAQHRREGLHDYDCSCIRGGIGIGGLYGDLKGRLCTGYCDDVWRDSAFGYGCDLPAGRRVVRGVPEDDRLYERKRDDAHVVADRFVLGGDDSHDQLWNMGITADGAQILWNPR